MYAKAILDTSQRHGELQYVTSHFQNLQGLRSAPCWLSFLVLTGIAAGGVLSGRNLVLAAFAIAVLNFGVYFAVGHWYSRRFGVVKRPDLAIPSGLISIMNPEVRTRAAKNYPKESYDVIFMIWILSLGPSLFRRVDRDSGLFCLLAVVYALLPRVVYSGSEVGLIRVRRYAASAGALILCLGYLGFLYSHAGRWQVLGVLFTTLLLLDLYDHWLLTRLLSGPASGATNA
jgi:hypothetical protein